jgi:nicotinamide phosphoribosyltransferase
MKNAILNADAYTICGNALVSPEARQRSSYYMANRTSPRKAFPELATNDKMVMWGLNNYIHNNTLGFKAESLVDAIAFMDRANAITGRELKFDRKMWDRVLREYKGNFPIHIEGLPEGSVFYPHQPMVQVTSLDEGFGEVAAHVEAVLVGTVSIGTARATLTAHLFDFMLRNMRKYNPSIKDVAVLTKMARNSIHDFGMRASSCAYESELLGMAHLLFFNGTDTFNAAATAYFGSDEDVDFGRSVLALAHRVVQSYEHEGDAYLNLMEQDVLGSYVADCYDYKRAINNDLIPLALKNPGKHIVARPDSGNAVDNAVFAVKAAITANLFVNGADGAEPKNFTLIEGNTVTPKVIKEIYEALYALGCNPSKWIIFGIGGWLRNSVTRDTFSSAYKLHSVGVGAKTRPVMKFSETPEKESIPGPFKLYNRVCVRKAAVEAHEITRLKEVPIGYTDFVTYYDAEWSKLENTAYAPKFVIEQRFGEARNRANYQWSNSPASISRDEIVGEMADKVEHLKRKYKGN